MSVEEVMHSHSEGMRWRRKSQYGPILAQASPSISKRIASIYSILLSRTSSRTSVSCSIERNCLLKIEQSVCAMIVRTFLALFSLGHVDDKANRF